VLSPKYTDCPVEITFELFTFALLASVFVTGTSGVGVGVGVGAIYTLYKLNNF
jgi:hypothetical protein